MKTPLPAPIASFRRLALSLAAAIPVVVGASEAPDEGVPYEPLPANSKVHYPWAGGVDPRPFLKSIARTNTAEGEMLLLQWSGLGGPYKVVESANVAGGEWKPVGGQTTGESAMVPVGAEVGIQRVQGPAPDYIGGSVCRGCHPNVHDTWAETAHKGALETLKAIGQGGNKTCLPCHTVGYGLPGGFVTEATTPRLAGVQCENCHGPAGNHVSDPMAIKPAVSLAGTMCGGCHTDFHHPTYDEWLTSAHLKVNEDFEGTFLSTNKATAEARMKACGACHSGAVRLYMLDGAESGNENPPMPSGDLAYHTGITCSVCHEPHAKTEYSSAQLRNPTYSTNFFSYYTATNTNFTLQYKEDIQMCAQCHNQRGGTWTGTSRPPHHSPQYNVLIGNIGDANIAGVDLSGSQQSSHRDIPHQCTHCHTHGHTPEHPSEEDPVYTGHSFQPLAENCVPCHTAEEGEAFISFRQRTTKAQIALTKTMLDTWGETKAPVELRNKYGKLSWEFTTAGQLSQPTNGPAVTGPTTAEQSKIPDDVKKARFLLYMIEHDGSYGVHNAQYSTYALRQATNLVGKLLAP